MVRAKHVTSPHTSSMHYNLHSVDLHTSRIWFYNATVPVMFNKQTKSVPNAVPNTPPHPRTQGQSLQHAVTRRNVDVPRRTSARWSTHFSQVTLLQQHVIYSSIGGEDTITANRYAFWNFERKRFVASRLSRIVNRNNVSLADPETGGSCARPMWAN